MSAEQLKQVYLSLPEEFRKELSLFVDFLVLKHKTQSQVHSFPTADLAIPGYKEPLDLSSFSISKDSFSKLNDLWEDELDAESLCKLISA